MPQPDPWLDLKAPQEWSSALSTEAPVLKRKRKGRGIVAWTLWVFAGGLFAAPLLADYADQAVESGVAWLATSAPGFVRPYLPRPIQAPASVTAVQYARGQASVAPSPVAAPALTETRPQAQPKIEPVKQIVDDPPVAAPSLKAVTTERPAKESRARGARAAHGKGAPTPAVAETLEPVVVKPAEPKHGASVDPFESGEGAPTPTRGGKAAAEPTAVKRSHDSLDDLMGDGPGGGDKAHDRRSTSKEIDAMLKGVQKSDAQPVPKRAESVGAPSPLTATDIARVMSGVKSSAAECGRRFGERGVADLKLTVGKDGTISKVAVRGKLADTEAGRCVSQAAHAAVFPPSSGLTFDYRIDLR